MDEAQVGGVGRPEGRGADPTRGGVDEGRVSGGQPRGEHLVRARVRARVWDGLRLGVGVGFGLRLGIGVGFGLRLGIGVGFGLRLGVGLG